MKKTLIAACAIVAMAGCNQSLIESPIAESDYGYISLGVTTDTEMTITKSGENGITTEATLTGYNISLTKEGANVWETTSKEYEAIIANDWKVPAGTYKIYVENLTQEEAYQANGGKGTVRVSGESDVQVLAGLTVPCTVDCTPQNSKVSFLYSEKFAEVFNVSESSVKVGDSSRELSLNMTLTTDTDATLDEAYFEPSTLTWTLTAKNMANEVKTYTKTFTTAKAKWTKITFDTGDTNGTIQVTITVNDQITDVSEITETIDPLSGTVTE